MKINQPNKFLFGLLTIVFSLICFYGTSLAVSTVIPAKSIISPLDGSLYAVDNSRSVINVYTYASSSWTKSTELALASGAKCYGLATSPSGDKLYVSVSNGSSSEIRIYALPLVDSTTYTTMSGASWSSSSSPAGMAIGGDRLFLVDQASGRFRIYNTVTNTYIKQISSGGISGLSNLYDIAVTCTSGTTYKIYISHKASTGSVFIYNYDISTDSLSSEELPISTSLSYPTFLKIYDSKLYVSVNGTDNVSVRSYNVSDNTPAGEISNPTSIPGSYGWTAFDTVSSGYLLFKKSANSSETTNRLCKMTIADIASGSTAYISAISVIKSDSVVIANDKMAIALTDSDTGSIEVLDNSRGLYFSISSTPSSPESLSQYAMDGTTLLSALVPANYVNYNYARTYAAYDSTYSTFTSRIKLKFSATDPSGSTISKVKVYYKQPTSTTWSTSTYNTGSFTLDGSNISLNFPQAGGLPREGAWEWGASVFNGTYWSDITYYNGTTNEADFYLDTTIPRPTFNSPTNLATNVSTKQQIVISFDEVMDTASTNFSLLCVDGSGLAYEGFSTPVWNADANEVTITHNTDAAFAVATTYQLSINAVDLAGNNVTSWDSYYLGARPDLRTISFTTRATNGAPGAFNLISPINGQLTNTTPSFSWDSSVDPNGDTVTYSINIIDEAGTSVYSSSTPSLAISLTSPLTVGKYSWTVSASDVEGAITTATNAPASFEVVADTVGDPTIVTAIPTDGSIDVPTSQIITLTFSEPMDSASLTSTPSIVWGSATWDTSRTIATFIHEAFALSTLYAITITGQDLYGSTVSITDSSAALGSNGTLDLTSSATAGEAIISGVSIVRAGDTVGSDVTVSWTTNPAGSAVNVFTKTGNFSTVESEWTLESTGTSITSVSFPDYSQVGNGIHKFYKIVPSTRTALVASDLTSEVVGKFDLSVGDYTAEPDKFFISLPIELSSTTLASALGSQPSEGDSLLIFDINKTITDGSIYSSGSWSAFPGATQITDTRLGYAYGYMTTTSKYISIVGNVYSSTNNRTITGAGGSGLFVCDWVGNAYPLSIGIASAGLDSSTAGTKIEDAGTIYSFNANGDMLDLAVHTSSGWVSSDYTTPSTMEIQPGKGYMFTEPGSSFTWTQPKAY
ncbi:MAG: Ig-like domain-containing protein [Candidatus Margulisiibacteriota bacterium]